MATLTNKNGTAAADIIDLTASGTYHANGGNDTINIKGGSIVVYTDSGNNIVNVTGGSGHTVKVAADVAAGDKINGIETMTVKGADIVDAILGSGKDVIVLSYTNGKKASGALSQIRAGAWGDTFTVNSGTKNYQLYGDAGDDTFNIKGGDNIIFWGGAANDTYNVTGGINLKLRGGDSADVYNISVSGVDMQLGYGNDIVNVTAGNNQKILANLGINTINLKSGSGHVITADIDKALSKKKGFTEAEINAGIGLGYGVDKVYITGTATNVTANLGDGKDIVNAADGTGHKIYTEGWGDTINISGASASSFDSGSGDDTIVVTGGTGNTVAVGDGEDTATISAGSVKLITSSDGSLNLSVENEGEVKKIEIEKGYANITIKNSTATELNTAKEADMVCAVLGGGHDTAYIYSDEAQLVLGAGRDHIEVYGKEAQIYGDHLDLSENSKEPTGTSYDDKIILHEEANYCFVDAGNGANTIGVNSTGNKIFTGSGIDTIEVSEKQGVKLDELKSVSVNNEIHAGDGDDKICVVVGAEYTYWENVYYGAYASVSGGAGNDTITYTKGTMALYNEAKSYAYGGSGDDRFYLDGCGIIANGGNGRDTFYNYAHINKGGNYMIGGAGSDKYYFDFSNGMSIENVYYIDNKSYHTSSDSDILGIIGFTGSLDEISLLGNKKNTSVRQLRIVNKSVTNSSNCHPTLNISISGFDMLSAINLYDNDGQLVRTLGSGTAFEEEWKSRGQFRDVSILECTQASFLNDGYYNSDYSDNIQYFVNDDADLKITGNSF